MPSRQIDYFFEFVARPVIHQANEEWPNVTVTIENRTDGHISNNPNQKR